jgi:AraC-like DNA-binding protein
MRLRLDMVAVQELLTQEDVWEPQAHTVIHASDTPRFEKGPPRGPGLAIGKTPAGLLGTASRLVDLLDTPEDIPFLTPLIHRELVYRILRTPQGERLRAIATRGDLSNRTAKVIAWLQANYTKPVHVEELADIAQMGVSTLHHQFRSLTTMSPLQYQKQLRLLAARQRMLTDGIDVTSAAYEVGYGSVSQFSREYSRFFGQPPLRDLPTLRSTNIQPIYSTPARWRAHAG